MEQEVENTDVNKKSVAERIGWLFGGTIAEVIGGHVATDEHEMLSGVIAE